MITARNLTKTYRTKGNEGVTALNGVDIDVEDGEFFVLLGPSGSGKTTLLRCIAGLEKPDSGELWIGDRLVFSGAGDTAVPSEERRLGMVFQSYAIWPHMTVYENIALPLKRGTMSVPKDQIRGRVHRALSLVGMEGLADRPAPQLSGGQQQRVALARALAVEPQVLLMDEPLSNLDARLREQVRSDIRALVGEVGLTVAYVTHDQDEAMDIADRIAVMHNGNILQVGPPEDLYRGPTNPRVAQFFGEMNWVRGEVIDANTVKTSMGVLGVGCQGNTAPGTWITLGIRPEDIALTQVKPEASDGLSRTVVPVHVAGQTFLGDRRIYVVESAGERLRVNTTPSVRLDGDVFATIDRDQVICFDDSDEAERLGGD